MQMYPGAGYKEHHYKVETEDYTIKDDFHFNKNSGMNKIGHSNTGPKHNYMAGNHHNQDELSPNMHMMKSPDHCNPNSIKHVYGGGYNPNSIKHVYGGGYHGPNKNGMNYSETIYEQEETKYHVNKFDDHYSGHHGGVNNNNNKHFNGGDQSYYMSGAPSYGGYKEHDRYYSDGRIKAPAMWDCKGIDD